MRKQIYILWSVLVAGLYAGDVPKNIVLMIGDGMGVSQITAGKIVKKTLEMERLHVGGLMTTFSADHLVTDSAAGGTALATGYKVNNDVVSMTTNNSPLETASECAKEHQKAVGLVTVCSLTHATPAAFAAHAPNRFADEDIARQIVDAGFDVLFGSGWAWFVPVPEDATQKVYDKTPAGYGKAGASLGQRTDGRNLLEELRRQMPVARTPDEFRSIGETNRASALLYSLHPPPAEYRSVPLAELTEKALDILSSDPDGFFLMVEGSQIDWACHKNNKDWLVDEMIDFDNAVGVVMDFADMHSDTLVVITADHETGGFAIHDGSVEEQRIDSVGFTSRHHTASMVPVLANGPGADVFGGIIDNTTIGQILMKYVAVKPAE